MPTTSGSKSGSRNDFRKLTPLVLMAALRQAGTTVCAPVNDFELELPSETIHPALGALANAGATVHSTTATSESARLTGESPSGTVQETQQRVAKLTRAWARLSRMLRGSNRSAERSHDGNARTATR